MEQLKHECGVAMIRLLKPLDYYEKKYGTRLYGLNKLYLMMEKQHNRGQEGAGIASVQLNAVPGQEYMFREKAEGKDAITEIFARALASSEPIAPLPAQEGTAEPAVCHFNGELLMGHLRYSTTGKSGLTYVHPFLRRNNWRAKNLCLCGNFNMTNIDEVFDHLTAQGQYPRIYSDSYIILELMGHRLDREVERNYVKAKAQGLAGMDITDYIDSHVDIANVLRSTMPQFDGGYVICGMTGSGEFFSVRDPWGIRPAFYYQDDEIVALASERPVLQTTFDLPVEAVRELPAGQALIVNRSGEISLTPIFSSMKEPVSPHSQGLPVCESPLPQQVGAAGGAVTGGSACSFERIYFSRGNDADIYRERQRLGEQLVPAVTAAINGEVENTVFSFIPNTAEVAYYGLLHGFMKQGHDVRIEKIAWKDIKLRTFITEGNQRNDLAAHVYDITYGVVRPGEDNLVVIDDSIVRGTTLKESIIKILDRLHPKKIVLVSSAPQVRYPDFYGIDMAHLEEFIAFRACIELLKDKGMGSLIEEVCRQCEQELEKPASEQQLPVQRLYEPFSVRQLNEKMVEMLRPEGVTTPIELVYQSVEGLHTACPNHPGDWYFTGNYPTPGGTKLCNKAFVNFCKALQK